MTRHPALLGAVRSELTGVEWPGARFANPAMLGALSFQLEQSQWWPPERLLAAQLLQLGEVLRHADTTVPFYRARFKQLGLDTAAPLDYVTWQQIPLLTRYEIQDHFDALQTRSLPKQHGNTSTTQTSGSSGRTVRVVTSDATGMMWLAMTLREHTWQRRDLGGLLCSIRALPPGQAPGPNGVMLPNWGPATDFLFQSGPCAVLNLSTDVSVQVPWLLRHNPDYLLTYPSNILALADHFEHKGLRLNRLRQVRAIGENATDEVRQRCQEVWDVPLCDSYSSQEVGYIAMECPDNPRTYHIQCENLLVEVLDDHGRPCAPGQIGRVVLSSLHNFAMPLIRYEILDYAEVGLACSCGRGLPVLARILGRRRNMLSLPNGDKRWPLTGSYEYRAIAPIRQYQLVQKSLEEIEARLVAERPLSAAEEERLRAVIVKWLQHPFRVGFVYLNEFPKTAGGKFEEFISEVA